MDCRTCKDEGWYWGWRAEKNPDGSRDPVMIACHCLETTPIPASRIVEICPVSFGEGPFSERDMEMLELGANSARRDIAGALRDLAA